MRDAGFEVGPGNGFEAQRCVKSDEVLLRRDADGLRTPRPGDMPQGFVHQAAAQPAAAVTGVYQHPSDGCLGADDPCGDDPQECDDAAVLLRPEKDALRIDLVGVGS